MLLIKFFKKSTTILILSCITTSSFLPLRKLQAFDKKISVNSKQTQSRQEEIKLNKDLYEGIESVGSTFERWLPSLSKKK